jgi:hypothetical protein
VVTPWAIYVNVTTVAMMGVGVTLGYLRVVEAKEYPQADLQTPILARCTFPVTDEDEEYDEEDEDEEVVDPEDEEVVEWEEVAEEWEELDVDEPDVDEPDVDEPDVDECEELDVEEPAADECEVLVVDDPEDILDEGVEDVAWEVDDDADVVAGVLDDVATLVVLWLDVELEVWVAAMHKFGSRRFVEGCRIPTHQHRQAPQIRCAQPGAHEGRFAIVVSSRGGWDHGRRD